LRSDPDLVNAPGHQRQPADLLAMSFGGLPWSRICSTRARIRIYRTTRAGPRCIRRLTRSRRATPGPAVALLDRLLAAGASPYRGGILGTAARRLRSRLFWVSVPLAPAPRRGRDAPCNLRVPRALGRLDLMRALFEGGPLASEAGLHRDSNRPHSGFPRTGGRPTRRRRSSQRR
jgi:hypothetical protein